MEKIVILVIGVVIGFLFRGATAEKYPKSVIVVERDPQFADEPISPAVWSTRWEAFATDEGGSKPVYWLMLKDLSRNFVSTEIKP